MSLEKSPRHARPNRTSVAFEEEKAWISFYRGVGDPAVAAEVIQHLESDPEMKRTHPALYLRCKQSQRRHKERQSRAKRIGHFVRLFISTVLISPLMAMRRLMRNGSDIAMECLPEVTTEPAGRRVKTLAKKPDFASARTAFTREDPAMDGAESQASHGPDRSRSTKTA